jgi:hypothetical protein
MEKLLVMATTICLFSSCATLCGGKISDCQKTKPQPGQPKRVLRWYTVVPVPPFQWGPVGMLIDVLDGAAYRPCKK